MNAKFLLRKYLNTGEPIPEYQFNKLNTNLRTTYIRKRSIAIESGDYVQTFEVPYISQDTWIKSLEKNQLYIQYIKNPTPKVQMYAVEKDPSYIELINNPTPQVQMYAVKYDPYNIEYIQNPTPEVQMIAIEKDSYLIQYIENPTPQVQDYILKNDKEYIFQINNPNDKIKSLLDLEEYQMVAIEDYRSNIKYIKNPTPKVQMYAVEEDPSYIEFIENPTPQVQDYILNNHPKYIFKIKNPTPQVQMIFVKVHPSYIKDFKNPTPQVQMYVVKKKPFDVYYIENPTDEVQDYILDNYPEYIRVIKNPNEKIKRYLLGNNINENTKKMKIILKESQIKNIISDIINKNDMSENYMFFSNLKQIKRQCELLLELNTEEVDNIIKNGHDWADDHISEAKNNMDQVFDFFMNETSNHEINEGKNKPTNPKLWQASLAWAKTKYDVCPSAYCNGAAAKRYKSKGGGSKKSITEIKNNNFETYHKTYTSAINDDLDYAEKKGYTYDNDEVFTKIAMGPKKPKEGDTNRFSISLKKDDKEQKKSLNIQVYGMKETYELNCYIN